MQTQKMTKLLIVESPSKAKTLNKYLGKDYEVLASYGHVRNLLSKNQGINTENFEMRYELIDRNKKHIDAITKAVKKSDEILLATDPDREGEAIAWHLAEILNEKKLIKNKSVRRVVFQEITKSAIIEAIQNPRDIATPLVFAQQARQALDYLIGFNLSPLLWKKIRYGLSAGRVQSPALRLIVEREIEIEKFDSQEYWTVHLDTAKEKSKFSAKLIMYKGEKVEQFSISDAKKEQEVVGDLLLKSSGKTKVSKVEKKQRTRKPTSPFTTSTLQQESVRKLGFTTKRTMIIAQQLYEGSATGDGLITYMRTDSMTLSNDAINQIRSFLKDNYDAEYLPPKPIAYKTKAKNAQEAHEAIRPTDISKTPVSLKAKLSDEQYKLYEIIWKRTIACQMTNAVFDAVSVDLAAGSEENIFRATGQTIKFPGFMSVYLVDEDEGSKDSSKEKNNSTKLPNLMLGDTLSIGKISGVQHFTEPAPRFSEASLVKTLEEHGIGRPSTYSSIITTLQDRDYVLLEKKRFTPTDVGKIVIEFLTEHFTDYVDYDFTANLESQLDEIAADNKNWLSVLEKFWVSFDQKIKEKSDLDKTKITQKDIGENCPKCSKPLLSKLGRRGNFIACSSYPECDFTRSVNGDVPQEPKVIAVDKESKKDILMIIGPYGPYLQLGIQEEGDKLKPKRITIPPELPLDQLNEEWALKLISLPKDLGVHPDTGKKIIANIGRFGPYVNHNGKFKSIPKTENIFEISHETAVELLKPLKKIGNDPDKNSSVDVYKGRFGFYIQRDLIKVNIAKTVDYESISLEKAIEMLAKKELEEKSKKKPAKKKTAKKKTAKKKPS